MTQRETELEHELATALRKVDEQRELLRLCKEENEEKRKDIVWTMGERAKLIDRIKQLEEMYEGEPGERPDLLGSNVMGLLKRELNAAQDRIKRLEKDSERLAWLLKTGLAWRGCYNGHWLEGEWLYTSQYAIATIDKAKEDKL